MTVFCKKPRGISSFVATVFRGEVFVVLAVYEDIKI
jgi:hypothetical protein